MNISFLTVGLFLICLVKHVKARPTDITFTVKCKKFIQNSRVTHAHETIMSFFSGVMQIEKLKLQLTGGQTKFQGIKYNPRTKALEIGLIQSGGISLPRMFSQVRTSQIDKPHLKCGINIQYDPNLMTISSFDNAEERATFIGIMQNCYEPGGIYNILKNSPRVVTLSECSCHYKGENGREEVKAFSSPGGHLAASSISSTYVPSYTTGFHHYETADVVSGSNLYVSEPRAMQPVVKTGEHNPVRDEHAESKIGAYDYPRSVMLEPHYDVLEDASASGTDMYDIPDHFRFQKKNEGLSRYASPQQVHERLGPHDDDLEGASASDTGNYDITGHFRVPKKNEGQNQYASLQQHTAGPARDRMGKGRQYLRDRILETGPLIATEERANLFPPTFGPSYPEGIHDYEIVGEPDSGRESEYVVQPYGKDTAEEAIYATPDDLLQPHTSSGGASGQFPRRRLAQSRQRLGRRPEATSPPPTSDTVVRPGGRLAVNTAFMQSLEQVLRRGSNQK